MVITYIIRNGGSGDKFIYCFRQYANHLVLLLLTDVEEKSDLTPQQGDRQSSGKTSKYTTSDMQLIFEFNFCYYR